MKIWLDCQFEGGDYRRSGRYAKARTVFGAAQEAAAMFTKYGVPCGQVMLVEGNPYAPDGYHGYVVKQSVDELPYYDPNN